MIIPPQSNRLGKSEPAMLPISQELLPVLREVGTKPPGVSHFEASLYWGLKGLVLCLNEKGYYPKVYKSSKPDG